MLSYKLVQCLTAVRKWFLLNEWWLYGDKAEACKKICGSCNVAQCYHYCSNLFCLNYTPCTDILKIQLGEGSGFCEYTQGHFIFR